MRDTEIKEYVKKRYSEIAKSEETCCTASCCNPTAKDVALRIGYSKEDLKNVPEASSMGLGCGNPVALAGLKEGETVLDLGSGGGIDVFLAAKKVGETGRVIGIDMTEEMINRARATASKYGHENVEFRSGEIENLPVEDNSIDVVISNCVINLSPDKENVFREAYRVLKPAGRIMISDIVTEGELPDEVRKSFEAWAGCVAGALQKNDYLETIKRAGFKKVKIISESRFDIDISEDVARVLKELDFMAYFNESPIFIEGLKIEQSKEFPKGIPKDKGWIGIKPFASIPFEWIKQFSDEPGLEHKTQKDGYVIIYGEETKLKGFVSKIIKLVKSACTKIVSVQVKALKI